MATQKLYAGAKLRETRTRLGLTQKAFCKQHQIGLASFQRWRGIFAKEGTPEVTPATFLPINLVQSASAPSLAYPPHAGFQIGL